MVQERKEKYNLKQKRTLLNQILGIKIISSCDNTELIKH